MSSVGARILLVDDDVAVLSSLHRALASEGYLVLAAEDGETAVQMATRQLPDLIVLDVVLPDVDGFDVCRRVRASTSAPILLLSARDTVPDRVHGLNQGADDYLVKPFALEELLARIRALLRRSQGQPTTAVLRYGDLRLDLSTREAFRAERPLHLTPHQFALLAAFVRHPRQALTREQLCEQVWRPDFEGESNFVDVAVMDLRRKLEAHDETRLIQTVRGVGYALRES